MATWCVYHLIHVRTPHQHIPKLVIEDVPTNTVVMEDLLERAGYLFEEFSIPWANHVLAAVGPETSPSDLVARIRQGGFERIGFAELRERAAEEL